MRGHHQRGGKKSNRIAEDPKAIIGPQAIPVVKAGIVPQRKKTCPFNKYKLILLIHVCVRENQIKEGLRVESKTAGGVGA